MISKVIASLRDPSKHNILCPVSVSTNSQTITRSYKPRCSMQETTRAEFEALMIRVRARKPEAIRELSERYREIVQRIVGPGYQNSKHARHMSISDLVQDGLIEVLSKMDQVQDASNMPAYVNAMARNKLLASLRKLHAKKRDIDRVEKDAERIDHEFLDEKTASDWAVESEEIARIVVLLKSQEEAILWAYLSGYNQSEIGNMFKKSTEEVARVLRAVMDIIRSSKPTSSDSV